MLDKILPLIKQTIVYGVGGLAVPLVGILLVPIYTRVFSPEDYGIINLVQITITLLTALLILGLDNASGRYYLDTTNSAEKRVTASTSLAFMAAVMLIGCLLFIGFSEQISQMLFKTNSGSQYLVIAAAAVPFSICGIFCLDLLRFNLRPISYTGLSIANLLLTVVVTILLVVILKMGVKGVFIATLFSSCIFFGINLTLTRKYFALVFSRKRLLELLKYGLPLVPYGIAIFLMQNCDRYFLSQYATLEDVGLYNLGWQIASIASLFFVATGLAWSPFIYMTYKDENIGKVYTKLIKYFIAAALFIVVGISIFSHEILIIFATSNYYGAYIVIPFLVLDLTFFYLGLRLSFGINISKKTLHFTWISIVVAVADICLNYLLVPLYGMIGAATATLISAIIWFILLVWVSRRYYLLEFRSGAFLGILGVSVAIIITVYFWFNNVSWQNVIIKTVMIGFFIIATYLLGFVGSDELRYISNAVSRVKKKQ